MSARRDARRTALLAIAGMAVVAYLWLFAIHALGFGEGVRGLVLALAVSLVAPTALLALAFRRSGWDRWVRVLGAYALVVAMFGCPLIPGAFNLFSGGLTFLLADATLLVLVAVQLW